MCLLVKHLWVCRLTCLPPSPPTRMQAAWVEGPCGFHSHFLCSHQHTLHIVGTQFNMGWMKSCHPVTAPWHSDTFTKIHLLPYWPQVLWERIVFYRGSSLRDLVQCRAWRRWMTVGVYSVNTFQSWQEGCLAFGLSSLWAWVWCMRGFQILSSWWSQNIICLLLRPGLAPLVPDQFFTTDAACMDCLVSSGNNHVTRVTTALNWQRSSDHI